MKEHRAARSHALAEELAAELAGPRREAALRRFDRARGNLHEVLDHFVGAGDAARAVRLVTLLRDCWWESGHLDEGRRWADRVLTSLSAGMDKAARATLLDLAGALAYGDGDYEAARRQFEESLAIRLELGSSAEIAQSLNHLAGVLRWGMGDLAAARRLMEESLTHARRADARFLTGAALLGLGTIAIDLGDHGEARSRLAEAAAVLRAEQRIMPFVLDDFAALAAAEGRARRALRLAGAAAVQHESLATFRAPNIKAWHDRYLALAREGLPEGVADAEWTTGRAMTPEQAIAYALAPD